MIKNILNLNFSIKINYNKFNKKAKMTLKNNFYRKDKLKIQIKFFKMKN